MNEWHKAILVYEQVLATVPQNSELNMTMDFMGSGAFGYDTELQLKSKIRECDLLQTLYFGRQTGEFTSDADIEFIRGYAEARGYANVHNINWNQEVANCWLKGVQLFPKSHVMYNELGNLLLRVCLQSWMFCFMC